MLQNKLKEGQGGQEEEHITTKVQEKQNRKGWCKTDQSFIMHGSVSKQKNNRRTQAKSWILEKMIRTINKNKNVKNIKIDERHERGHLDYSYSCFIIMHNI